MFMYIHSWQNMLDKTETAKCIGYYGASHHPAHHFQQLGPQLAFPLRSLGSSPQPLGRWAAARIVARAKWGPW